MTNYLLTNNLIAPNVVHPQGEADPLEGAIDAFCAALIGRNRAELTIKAYRRDLFAFVDWLRGINVALTHPGQVTRTDIEAYLSVLGRQKLSGVTRARKLAAIREWFRFLVDHGVLPHSPAAAVKTPKREQKTRTWLRSDEYNRLLSAAGVNPRDYAILQVFLQTGVRVHELAELRLSDLDLGGRRITVRGKGQTDRVIQLEKKATASLKSWLDLRPRSPFDHVFLNYQGMPLTDRSIRRLVAKYVERAGIEKRATPHSLRHTFASHKARAGVSLRQVQAWLGTTQIYTHLASQDAHKAREASSL